MSKGNQSSKEEESKNEDLESGMSGVEQSESHEVVEDSELDRAEQSQSSKNEDSENGTCRENARIFGTCVIACMVVICVIARRFGTRVIEWIFKPIPEREAAPESRTAEEHHSSNDPPEDLKSDKYKELENGKLTQIERFKLFAQATSHEDNLLNHRISWLILSQTFLMLGFLTATMGNTNYEDGKRIRKVVAICGIVAVVLTIPPINAAQLSLGQQRKKYDEYDNYDDYIAYCREATGRNVYEETRKRLPNMCFEDDWYPVVCLYWSMIPFLPCPWCRMWRKCDTCKHCPCHHWRCDIYRGLPLLLIAIWAVLIQLNKELEPSTDLSTSLKPLVDNLTNLTEQVMKLGDE